tara:strand:+ start:576 stop:851 length:276 start_codon:yes stop_codon:yes gene_type:complete
MRDLISIIAVSAVLGYLCVMAKQKTAVRMGRPPGTAENEHLIHVRLPDDLKAALEKLRDDVGVNDDRPSLSRLIRIALREYVSNHCKDGLP